MAYIKVFNYLDTIMRSEDKKKLVLPPFSKNIDIESGYYSKANNLNLEQPTDEEQNTSLKKSFELKGVTYSKRSEVIYQVDCNINALTNFLQKMTWMKSELSSADLHVLCEKVTIISWKNICNSILKIDPNELIQKRDYSVLGENPMQDIYGGIFSIVYVLIYNYIAKDKCEPSQALYMVKQNIENLDKFWGGNSEEKEQVKLIIGKAVDNFVNTFLQPYVETEMAKVGQAHVNENLTSIMSEYKDLKNKVTYIMGGYVHRHKDFIILEDYINMILGREESFYRLLRLIIAENLDKDLNKLQERLTIDNDILENFIRRLITSNLQYITNNQKSILELKSKLSGKSSTVSNNVEIAVRGFMREVYSDLSNGYMIPFDTHNKLPIVKITNCKSTSYLLRANPGNTAEDVMIYKEVTSIFKKLATQFQKFKTVNIVEQSETKEGNYKVLKQRIHFYDIIELVIRVNESQPDLQPILEIRYESANMKDIPSNKLTWQTTTDGR